MTPYACRHSDNSAFMCKTSALNLVNPSDVFTWQRVEVDSSFGGCSTGAYNCSTYSDCNPVDGSDDLWHCACKASPHQFSCSSDNRLVFIFMTFYD